MNGNIVEVATSFIFLGALIIDKPVLQSLHWLPIHRRIEFKILLLVYLCLHDIAPQYLAEMLTTHAVTRSLRSTDKQLLVVPRSKLKRHGDRSFNVVAPVLWNSQLITRTRQVTRATHVRNRVCPRVELILKIIIILLIIFLGFIKSKPC